MHHCVEKSILDSKFSLLLKHEFVLTGENKYYVTVFKKSWNYLKKIEKIRNTEIGKKKMQMAEKI